MYLKTIRRRIVDGLQDVAVARGSGSVSTGRMSRIRGEIFAS